MYTLIEPSVRLITEENPFKRIEVAGRTCYKSEDKITEDSCYRFYNAMVKNGHYAMLEHAHFVFEVSCSSFSRYKQFKYLNTTCVNERVLVSGNLRAINESGCLYLLEALRRLDERLFYGMRDNTLHLPRHIPAYVVKLSEYKDLTREEFLAHSFYTFHFITDRGVTHEMVRHRPASYAQQSTRYVNFAKSDELVFIKPSTYDDWDLFQREQFDTAIKTASKCYLEMTMSNDNKSGLQPQQSRAILPNALKTEIFMSANANEFEHFFDLRSYGTTGKPHPDIKVVSDKALEIYTQYNQEKFGFRREVA